MTDSLDAKVARLEEALRQRDERIEDLGRIIDKHEAVVYGERKDGTSGLLHDMTRMKAESRFWKAAYFFGGAFGTAIISWLTEYFLPKPGQ